MAVLVISQPTERELKAQAIKSGQKIEWIKVVAAASTTGEGTTYALKSIRSYIGALCCGGFSVTVSGSTATITPLATITGIYFIGLLGSINE